MPNENGLKWVGLRKLIFCAFALQNFCIMWILAHTHSWGDVSFLEKMIAGIVVVGLGGKVVDYLRGEKKPQGG